MKIIEILNSMGRKNIVLENNVISYENGIKFELICNENNYFALKTSFGLDIPLDVFDSIALNELRNVEREGATIKVLITESIKEYSIDMMTSKFISDMGTFKNDIEEMEKILQLETLRAFFRTMEKQNNFIILKI